MTLAEYLAATGCTLKAFSDESGVPVSTLDRVAKGLVRPRIDICGRIRRASQRNPAPDGGFVLYEDLDPSECDESAA